MSDTKIISKKELDKFIDSIGIEFILKNENNFIVENEEVLTEELKLFKNALKRFEEKTGYKIELF